MDTAPYAIAAIVAIIAILRVARYALDHFTATEEPAADDSGAG
jgi:hypothetical protein